MATWHYIWVCVGLVILTIVLLVIVGNIINRLVVKRVDAVYPTIQLGPTDVSIVVEHDRLSDVTLTINKIYSTSVPTIDTGTHTLDLSGSTSQDGETLKHTREINEVHIIGRIGSRKVDTTITFGRRGEHLFYQSQEILLE